VSHPFPDIEGYRSIPGSCGADPEIPFVTLVNLINQARGDLIRRHAFCEPASCLLEKPEIVMIGRILRIDLDQLAMTALGDRVVLPRQHLRRCREPEMY
jgi:hypothetical protein